MTTDDLRKIFNDHYDQHGLEKPIESPYYVDADTYGHVCDEIINGIYANPRAVKIFGKGVAIIDIGPNLGIMFHQVELLIKSSQ